MSRPVQLILPRQFLDAMIQHARAELPNECCGLLAGARDGDVLRAEAWHPLVNEAANPTVEYLSAPNSMLQAVKAMRKEGHDIVAVYHSHPSSAPVPSRTDLERSYSPDVVHFIIGLADRAPLVRGWWLTEKGYDEATWQIS